MSPSARLGAKKKPKRAKPAKVSARGSKPRDGRQGGRQDLLWTLLLTLLAWLHRIFFIVSNSDRGLPVTEFYYGDSKAFFLYARAILAGQPYDAGIPFHPPGFAYFLAGVHRLLGAGDPSAAVPHLYVKITLALVSSLSVGLLFLLIKPYLGRTVALLTGLLCAFHFGLAVLGTAPVTEGLYLTLLMTCLLIWTRKLEHPLAAPGIPRPSRRSLWGLLFGLFLGLLTLVRAEALLLVALLVGIGLLGWMIRPWTSRRSESGPPSRDPRGWLPWGLALLAFAITLTPNTLRNQKHLRRLNVELGSQMEEPLPTLVPLTLYGPLNLALANHSQADGTFSRDVISSQTTSGRLDVRNPQHLRFLLHGDEMAWDFIRQEPAAFGRLVLKKWKLYFGSARLGWTQWNFPGGLAGLRRPVDIFVPYSSAAMAWILGPAFLGWILCLWRPGSERRWGLLVLLLTATSLWVAALFFGYARQGLLLLPLWLSLGARAFTGLGSGIARLMRKPPPSKEPSKALLIALATVTLSLLLLEAWGSTRDRSYQFRGTNLPGKLTLNPDLTVYIRPLPASETPRP